MSGNSSLQKKKNHIDRAYNALQTQHRGYLIKQDLLNIIQEQGILQHDDLKEIESYLKRKKNDEVIDYLDFAELVQQNYFFRRVMEEDMAIPGFQNFKKRYHDFYQIIKNDPEKKYQHGNVATYIPPLAQVDPELFATAFCSIDGQYVAFGDTEESFSIQSVGKVVSYAYLYNEIGEEVHKYVGEEPSGEMFNAPVFDDKNKPHNPMINSGAIMVCALLVHHNKKIEDVVKFYSQASNTSNVRIDYELAYQEKIVAHNNNALASLMLSNKAFPQYEDARINQEKMKETLDFYFQLCSILVTVKSLSHFGATLANNGIVATTGQRVLESKTIHAVVPLMVTCGMYNGAGKFVKDWGVPSKSGVSGDILIVIPNVGSCVNFSPKLDSVGNTVKGVGMIGLLSSVYNNFNLFQKDQLKMDCCRKSYTTKIRTIIQNNQAAANGDIDHIQRAIHQNADLNLSDYDDRTPLHLAVQNSHIDIVKLLINQNVNINPVDRFGSTPLNDASDEDIYELLKKNGGILKKSKNDYQIRSPKPVNDNFYRLMYAAAENNIILLKVLNIIGWKVNFYDYDGRSPLNIAASFGHLETVEYLIGQGADILHQDFTGTTPLDDAIRENQKHVIDFIQARQNYTIEEMHESDSD